MSHSRRRFIAVFATAATAALTGSARPGRITRQRFRALGTEAQITLLGRPKQAEAALQACRSEVADIEGTFSLYDPDSTLSKLNRDGSVTATSRFATLLHHALSIADATGGAFDPTVQPLWRALATDGNIEQARQLVGWRRLQLTSATARFTVPNMAATFNGIAQGYAADRVSATLAQHGFSNMLVDLGEFAARGAKPGAPWLLGIRNPLTQRIVTRINPVAGAIATSEPRGTLLGEHPHIFDPLERAGDRWISVTVEAREAWRADALSTAIAASPTHEADNLLVAGGATRGWLIKAPDTLYEWQANDSQTHRI